ncbi:Protein of unknown function [Cotesia congregata]|uniref:Uncharacterized protein n=1 Tax=Cotesia congregata TaxID=51543 RepID=A0A8J2E5P8_COTCN|nr:Protein of unknown function [Cotesia congregata]
MKKANKVSEDRKNFRNLPILDKKNYTQVCEAIKTGKLSKDVMVKVPFYCFSSLRHHDHGKLCTYLSLPTIIDYDCLSMLHVSIALDDQAMVDQLLALKVNLQATTKEI